MEPLIAGSIDEMIVDFHLAGTADGHSADIIVAAAQRVQLQGYMERLVGHGINPVRLTAGHYGLPCCLAGLCPGARNSLCVQLEANATHVAAIVSGRLALMHRFSGPVDGPLAASQIRAWLQQAVHLVEAVGLGRFDPESVWLGGNAADNGLAEALAAEIRPLTVTPIDLVRDLERVKMEPVPRDWSAGPLDRALALALLEAQDIGQLNFRRGPLAPRRLWEEHKRRIVVSASAAFLVAGLGLAGLILDVTGKQARVKALDQQIGATFGSIFGQGAKMVDPVGQTRLRIGEIRKQARFSQDREGGHLALDILTDISAGIAKNLDVAVTRLEIGADSVSLSGDTATFDAVDEIKQKVQAAASFKEVTIASTNKDKTGSRVQFKLQMQLK
jgi:hypothetical protein